MVENKHHNELRSRDVNCTLNDGRVVEEFRPIFEVLREEGITTGEGITGCNTCIQSNLDGEYAYYMGTEGNRYVSYSSMKVAERIVELAKKEGIGCEWNGDINETILLKTDS